MTATIVIVRHGNTFAPGETPRRVGIRTDLPLVASGHAQAQALGAHFAAQNRRFDRILCSPLLRTRETADAIRAALTDPPPGEPSPLLVEVDHGPDENRPESAVVDRIGTDALDAWDRDGTPPDGWTVDRDTRIAGWRRLFADAGGDSILLVTSNGAARFALLADPSLHAQACRLPSLKLRTGAFGIIRISGVERELIAWDQRP